MLRKSINKRIKRKAIWKIYFLLRKFQTTILWVSVKNEGKIELTLLVNQLYCLRHVTSIARNAAEMWNPCSQHACSPSFYPKAEMVLSPFIVFFTHACMAEVFHVCFTLQHSVNIKAINLGSDLLSFDICNHHRNDIEAIFWGILEAGVWNQLFILKTANVY